jgi:transcription antitermination factor NusG
LSIRLEIPKNNNFVCHPESGTGNPDNPQNNRQNTIPKTTEGFEMNKTAMETTNDQNQASLVKIKVEQAREWNVIYTQARAEKRVYDRLLEENIEAYLPLYTTLRQWKDRKKKIELPLFNSYVFVRVNEKERLKALEIYGVVKFVYYLKKPAIVRPKEITAIKRFLNKSEGLRIRVVIGENVEIASGPMEGVYGKVIRIGKEKIVLQIEQLNMSLVAEVDKAQVRRPLKDNR